MHISGASSSSRTGSVPAIDLHHHHHGSGGGSHLVHHPAHVVRPPPHHELRRPDSVITTSSLVSSSDGASQAGDSSTEVGLHSVYAFSGLYGNKLAQVRLTATERGRVLREPFLSRAGCFFSMRTSGCGKERMHRTGCQMANGEIGN